MHPWLSGIRNQSEAMDVCGPIETPIGRLYVAGNGVVVTAVGRTVSAVAGSIQTRFGRSIYQMAVLPERLAQVVAAQLRGDGSAMRQFDLGDLPEHRAVLRAVLEIPCGEVRTYGQIAHQIGQPRAAKDVGQALGSNPIPLLIPCHRVVYSDGRLGGYIFGSRAKQAILHAEGVNLATLKQAITSRVA